jgi:hypothetical protein
MRSGKKYSNPLLSLDDSSATTLLATHLRVLQRYATWRPMQLRLSAAAFTIARCGGI